VVLPVSLNKEAGTTPCTTGEWGEKPTALIPLNEVGERYWIVKAGLELNREIGLGLATTWSVGRTMSAVRKQEEAVAMGRIFARKTLRADRMPEWSPGMTAERVAAAAAATRWRIRPTVMIRWVGTAITASIRSLDLKVFFSC